MSNPIISVIVPVFNTKHNDFLDCINSIEKQLKQISKLELIIIDDCSDIENSNYYKKICEEKENKFTNLIYKRLENNSGPGVSRRIGMNQAKGKYITFVDSDDELLSDALFTLYSISIKKPFLKMIAGRTIEIIQDGSEKEHTDNFIWIFGKLFDRQFLIDNNITFNDTRANEDNGFMTLFRMITDDYLFIKQYVYKWKYAPESITRINGHEYYFTSIEGYSINMVWVYEECKKRGLELSYKCLDHFASVWIRLYFYCVEVMYDRNDEAMIQLLKWCKIFYDGCYSELKSYIDKERFDACYKYMINNSKSSFLNRICEISLNEFNHLMFENGNKTAVSLYYNKF